MRYYLTDGTHAILYLTDGTPVPGQGAGDDEGGPTDPGTLTEKRQVTNNTAYYRTASTGSEAASTIITRHDVRAPARGLEVQLTSVDRGWGPVIVSRAGISVRGTFYNGLIDGEFGATIPEGTYARAVLDPDVQVEAGDTIYSVVEMAPESVVPTGTLTMNDPVSARLQTPIPSVVPPMSSQVVSGPVTGVYGLTTPTDRPKAIVLTGDSFMEPGWARKAAEDRGLAWSDWSVWLDTTHTTPMLDRMPASGSIPYDVAFVGWGGNDRSHLLPDWQAISIESWRLFESTGQAVGAKTLHPYSDTTDGWTTVEGQTHRVSAVDEQRRVDRNNWLRDGAPLDPATDAPAPTGTTDPTHVRAGESGHPLAFPVFDEAAATESSTDSGLWRVDGGPWVTDGAHLSAHGSTSLQPYFDAWLRANVA